LSGEEVVLWRRKEKLQKKPRKVYNQKEKKKMRKRKSGELSS